MEQATAILDHDAQQVLDGICIPACPAILTKLMREMRDDEPDFAKISKLISSDASLAAAMLQTVNSPFYGLRAQATSVQQATALLGLRSVAQLVTGLLLRSTFSNGNSDLMDEYWESSSGIANISAVLARQFKGFDRDEAYTFALFRDCGMLAMMDGYKDYKPVFPGVEPKDAATWGNGISGVSGAVSASNSLVGFAAGDSVSSYGITALANGNYVVNSPNWNSDRGAVSWGNGTSGLIGVVSSRRTIFISNTPTFTAWSAC